MLLIVINTGNTGNAKAHLITGGASGGDPFMRFEIDSIANFTLGLDNSDSDTFKMGWFNNPSAAGTDILLALTSGEIGLGIDPIASTKVYINSGTDDIALRLESTDANVILEMIDSSTTGDTALTRTGNNLIAVPLGGSVGILNAPTDASLHVHNNTGSQRSLRVTAAGTPTVNIFDVENSGATKTHLAIDQNGNTVIDGNLRQDSEVTSSSTGTVERFHCN